MSNINDRVAYLKGLAEGMKLTDETNEGKLLLKMLDAMQDMAEEITALRKDHDELDEYVESIDISTMRTTKTKAAAVAAAAAVMTMRKKPTRMTTTSW